VETLPEVQWEIQARSKFCCRCQREFLDGDRYCCVLTYGEDKPFRQDFCLGCWDSDQQSQFERDENFISWWRSSVKIPPPKPTEEAIKRSLAEQLLRKYLDSTEPKHINFRYILALMLERRRVLIQKHTIQESPSGKTLIVYEHAKTGETLLIEDPHLTLSQTGEVQAQVKEILDSEEKAKEAQQTQKGPEPSRTTKNEAEEELTE
jgi:hypothetical protein